jgi:antitoxin (DNA-binding transcriptional repressor) of toxin-antitoxin stability system
MTTITLEELQQNAFNAFQTAAGGTVVDVTRDGQVIARLSQAKLTEHTGITPLVESDFYQAADGVVAWVAEESEPVLVSTGLRDKSILIEPVVR